MTTEEYMQLNVGDKVYDKLTHKYMRVKRIYTDSEPAIQFEWIETRTIYAHSPQDIVRIG